VKLNESLRQMKYSAIQSKQVGMIGSRVVGYPISRIFIYSVSVKRNVTFYFNYSSQIDDISIQNLLPDHFQL